MAKPVPGDVEYAYNRIYVVVNPDPSKGPPTYRVSNPDELAGPGGGGGSAGGSTNIEGIKPIVATTDVAANKTEISMDIQQLNDRTT